MNSNFQVSEYLTNSIEILIKDILKSSLKNIKETSFIIKFKSFLDKSTIIRKSYEIKNINIPPFLIASISSSCNLRCKGCYALNNYGCNNISPVNELSTERWSQIFSEAESLGIPFILLAGGEPLLRREIIELCSEHKKIVFPFFTNGTQFDDTFINYLDDNRNVIPIISIEGDQTQTDIRRGSGIYNIIKQTMQSLNKKGILYGTSITATKDNLNTITNTDFINDLYINGSRVVFFVEYVPVTKETEHIAFDEKERNILKQKQVQLRRKFPNMIFISFPGDEKEMGGCLAAGRGFFHINPSGGAEPCPFSPYSDISLKDHTLIDAIKSPLFKRLQTSGVLEKEHTGGCTLFENKNIVENSLKNK